MTLSLRLGAASFDDVLGTCRVQVPEAATLVVSWDKKLQRAAAMGVLDEDGRVVETTGDLLDRLTGLLHRPLDTAMMHLAFPDADLYSSGMVTFNVSIDEPVWALILDTMDEKTQAGLLVSADHVRDALWLALEASGLPSGAVDVQRVAVATDVPGEPIFQPSALRTTAREDAAQWAWSDALHHFPNPVVAAAVARLVDWLARDAERHENVAAANAGGAATMATTMRLSLEAR